MNLLSDVITYVRRIIKNPSGTTITDNLIVDYINRFWTQDVDARMQLFDLKTNYTFQTIPGVCDYNMPVYQIQSSSLQSTVSYYPVYQGFMMPAYVNGIQIPFYTERSAFWNLWPNYVQYLNPSAVGDGTAGPYVISLPQAPAIPGHLDVTGVIAASSLTGTLSDPIFGTTIPRQNNGDGTFTNIIPYSSFYPGVKFTATDESGNNMTVQDSGIFLSGNNSSQLYGLLMTQDTANNSYASPNPYSYQVYNNYSKTLNTVNYAAGTAVVTFPNPVPVGANINAECLFYQPGLPRAVLYYNNVLTIRPNPDISYSVDLTAYLTPAAFLSTGQAVQFAYMSEYLARGAARKILSDTGDWEQFMAYEPLFREQETLVHIRSQRQFTSTRTGTIFSDLQGASNFNQLGAQN